MKLLKYVYEKCTGRDAPYYYNYSFTTVITKPIRKWFTNVVAANCPFNCIRVFIYRICGFKIGKNVFIGMRCYLDDMCYELMHIGDNVVISYGVFFSCHGVGQGHSPIIIEDGAYIGMRANLISNNKNKEKVGIVIGENAIIGACTLVNCDIPADATAIGIPCIIKRKETKK